MVQTVIKLFSLNKASLDERLGKAKEDQDILAGRTISIVTTLQDTLKSKGYRFFVSGRKLYRGVPERVLVVYDKAPFRLCREYDEKIARDFSESVRDLALPYEPEDNFIDYSRRRL